MPRLLSRFKSSILQDRLYIVFIYGLIGLVSFNILRTALLIKSAPMLDLSVPGLLQIYLQGIFFDVITISYFSIPAIIYLTLIPERLFSSRPHRWLTHIIFPLSVFGLLFVAVAEWFFWDEFGVRFNFISVDYLIYRHEVSGNIYETYPIPAIVSILLLTAGIIYLMLHRSVGKAFRSHSRLGQRTVRACLLILPMLVFFPMVNSDNFNFSDNRYENELARNGVYQ
ncbi:MAG: hypothetical protein EP315_02995, partial [Gammaproteobacteria bacterium]